ncbi:helical backbone metal receptor [Alteromonas sp. ASW11-130]|uniref:helical backbone metal receptor n=1 Tax=Alteromonas sp. ASW11-130 TaxID=3015775 RepID=UPI002241C001|nr:helical backbone metal receptor [Alteromonas sp. ASW11-130]MCW8091702.1 helical backbone metal receptor [Alteromonas sp. ASW11-130]
MTKVIPACSIIWLMSVSAWASAERIITLSPHLTEWIYSLEKDDELVAVSEFSNYPPSAKRFPTVANHNGINFKRIVTYKPTLILAWEGGNKPQDIARLQSLGFEVFTSSPKSPKDIAVEIRELGKRLKQTKLAEKLTLKFENDIADIENKFGHTDQSVFYYYWDKPLMTVGRETWANHLLNICGARTLFDDSPVDFPEVTLEEVLKRQPTLLIASSHQSLSILEQFWQPHRNFLAAPLVRVNPDVFSRFTLRLPNELLTLCKKISSN